MKLQFLNRHFVVAAFALLAVNVYAYDFEIDGIYYNVRSEKNRTVTVIQGWEYANGRQETVYYKGDITIPDRFIYNGVTYTVTSIDYGAFSYCRALTSVEFPASLTSIGNNAFYGCDALTSVDLSSTSLTSIGDKAFYGCHTLTSVDLSSTSQTSIGDEAFSGCGALTSVDLSSSSQTSIGYKAFCYCNALTSVDLSSTSLTSIGDEAFSGCGALTSVKFPASLTSIGDEAFCYCNALTSVEFPASLTSIGNRAFYGASLSNLTVDEDNPAFTLRDNVLYSKDMDTLVYYPAGANKEVVIPEMVRSVREDAFQGKVGAVYCQPQTPPEAVDGEFHGMFSAGELMNAVLYVPVGTKAAYMQVDPWRNFWNIEESDFATVGIDGVTAQGEPTVTVRGGKIVVDGASTTGVIEVFSTDGRCAYRGTSTVIEGLPKGAYVVRIGKFTQKVML